MKLRFYSVAEKTPPIGESIFKVSVKENEILGMLPCKAILQAVEELEKQFLTTNTRPLLTWDMGELGCFDMRYDDLWAFRTIEKGE